MQTSQTSGDGSFLFDSLARVRCQTKKNRPRVFDRPRLVIARYISVHYRCEHLFVADLSEAR